MNFDMNISLGFLLNRTALASKTYFNNELKKFDISAEQWSIIFRVVENKGLTQKELSNNTYKDQANITRSIDRLEKKEFLYRTHNEKDRRVINIFPTKKAQELVETIIPISSKHNEILLKDFNMEDQKNLIFLLNKVYKNIENKEK
ncbi:MAG: MarR family transcriptional regulator [Aliarcobacter sp.]|nr:MarR family transcriptional regulator [Aliarcobacter sp.]